MVIDRFKDSEMEVEQVTIKPLLRRRGVKPREGDELNEFWLFDFVVGKYQVAGDIVIKDV